LKPLSGLDAAFLCLETPATPMHVGSLHLYRVPPRARKGYFEKARKHIESRLHLVPVFTRRIASLPFDLASPMWVEDREWTSTTTSAASGCPGPAPWPRWRPRWRGWHGELLDRDRPPGCST